MLKLPELKGLGKLSAKIGRTSESFKIVHDESLVSLYVNNRTKS